MEKIIHDVDFLVKAGPYSHIVEARGFLFVSGMVPTDTERKVVKATVFLNDMADFNVMNEVYRAFFSENPPARSCVAVREIPGNFPLGIEVIAIK
jgi:enamine deaminase RidA (YjgF/YER057c/UK114 family)